MPSSAWATTTSLKAREFTNLHARTGLGRSKRLRTVNDGTDSNDNELFTSVSVNTESGWVEDGSRYSFCVYDLEVFWQERNYFIQFLDCPLPDLDRYRAARFSHRKTDFQSVDKGYRRRTGSPSYKYNSTPTLKVDRALANLATSH